MLALGWPIYRKTKDFSTALYATSLMPKTVVAGQGIKAFFGFPLLANVLLVATFSVYVVAQFHVIPLVSRVYSAALAFSTLLTALLLFAFLVLFVSIGIYAVVLSRRAVLLLRARGIQTFTEERFSSPRSIFSLVVFNLTLVSVFVMLFWGFYRDGLSSYGFSGRAILAALLVSFVGAFIMSVPAAITQKLDLPKVRIIGTEKTTVGTLIDHSGGCWHILVADGTIRAVPDGQVKFAHIMRPDTHFSSTTIR